MVKRLFLVVVFVLAVLTGYAIGQSNVKPLPGGPVFSGGDFGFQADEPLPDIMKNGRSSIDAPFSPWPFSSCLPAGPDIAFTAAAAYAPPTLSQPQTAPLSAPLADPRPSATL